MASRNSELYQKLIEKESEIARLNTALTDSMRKDMKIAELRDKNAQNEKDIQELLKQITILEVANVDLEEKIR